MIKLATKSWVKELVEKVVAKHKGGGEIYSTDETVVGTWIDGKPIYRKLYSIDSVVIGPNFKKINIDISNSEKLSECILMGYRADIKSNIIEHLTGRRDDSGDFMCVCRGIGSDIRLSNAYLILEYTKTTGKIKE